MQTIVTETRTHNQNVGPNGTVATLTVPTVLDFLRRCFWSAMCFPHLPFFLVRHLLVSVGSWGATSVKIENEFINRSIRT